MKQLVKVSLLGIDFGTIKVGESKRMNDKEIIITACKELDIEYLKSGDGNSIKVIFSRGFDRYMIVDTKQQTVETCNCEDQKWTQSYKGVIDKMKSYL